jgi:hypothetical protein
VLWRKRLMLWRNGRSQAGAPQSRRREPPSSAASAHASPRAIDRAPSTAPADRFPCPRVGALNPPPHLYSLRLAMGRPCCWVEPSAPAPNAPLSSSCGDERCL